MTDDALPDDASPPSARFGFHLVGLARRWRRHLDEGLASAGLTDATWRPLIHLSRAGGELHQKDLAARVGIDGSTLVRLLDILETQGLIARRVDMQDRRAKRLALTPAGVSAVKTIRRRIAAVEQSVLEGIDEADLKVALDVFARIEARIAAHQAGAEKP